MAVIAEPVAKPISRFHFILDRREVLETILVAPAILYVLLLVGLPLLLAVYYFAQRLYNLQPNLEVCRSGELRADPAKPDISRHTAQHLHLYIWFATARPRARKIRRLPAVAALPRPEDCAGADHPALCGAGRARHDRLAMDVRFALQRDQLDHDCNWYPHSRRGAQLARQSVPRDAVHCHHQRLAVLSVCHRDLPRRYHRG